MFDSNFDAALRKGFELFLRSPSKTYFVVEHEGAIVGCGGFEAQATEARLAWGTIRGDLQRQGLGRYLLLYRLKAIGNLAGIEFVHAVVPSPLARFYEKCGLKPQSEGEGMTRMRMKLQVCSA